MHKLYINPLPVRIWHRTNAVGFVLMIGTGLQIRFLDLFQLISFRTAVVAHNWIGFALIANFFLWLSFYLFTDKIKVHHPELSPLKYFRASFRQMQFYGYGIFRGDPNPHQPNAYRKFNALQSMMYQIVMMLLVPVQFVTGVLMWDVTRFSSMAEMFGGVRVVDTVHVLLFIFFSGFIIVQIYLGQPWPHPFGAFQGYVDRLRGRRRRLRCRPLKAGPPGPGTGEQGQMASDSPGSLSVSRTRMLYFFISA